MPQAIPLHASPACTAVQASKTPPRQALHAASYCVRTPAACKLESQSSHAHSLHLTLLLLWLHVCPPALAITSKDVRTQWFDAAVKGAIRDGITQVCESWRSRTSACLLDLALPCYPCRMLHLHTRHQS